MMGILRSAAVALALWAVLIPSGVSAGPISDFEAALKSAYADYRAALFQTNRKDKPATEAALARFLAQWRALASRWTVPPPHMMEDARWAETVSTVEAIAKKARAEADKGDLTASHETLEAIRDEIGALRARNGLISFSDRMNAYHEQMEAVLGRTGGALDAAALGTLREQAAVLAHLAESLSRLAPADLKADPKFVEALSAMQASVDALAQAARAGDAVAAAKALKELKAPYSRMFLQFG